MGKHVSNNGYVENCLWVCGLPIVIGHSNILDIVIGHSTILDLVMGHSIILDLVIGHSIILDLVIGHSIIIDLVIGHLIILDNRGDKLLLLFSVFFHLEKRYNIKNKTDLGIRCTYTEVLTT